MRSLHRNHYSCPSSCSSSPSESPAADYGPRKVMSDRAKSFTESRKLTRQRKLRYATDDELGLNSLSRSTPASPESTPQQRSPPRSLSVPLPRPVPLPLPELAAIRVSGLNGNQGSLCSTSAGRQFFFNCKNTNPSDQTLPRTHWNVRNEKPSTLSRRGFPQELNLDCVHLRRPNASAPSSPAISPTKSDHVFRGGWSALERQGSPRASVRAGKSSRSADHSPVHSPTAGRCSRSHLFYPRSQRSVSFPLGPNLCLFDSPRTWYENSVAHPLPLPPGPQVPSSQGCSFKPNCSMPLPSSARCQWQKGRLIGRGTFGSVYVATNRETGALCAMKEVDLIPDDPKSIECMRQLEQEIRLLRQLDHPNIVRYYGSEMTKHHFYIFLEYVHPGSINRYLQDHGAAMNESVVRNFTRHILSGLAYLHSKNTIHRDIKGPNLLVNAMGVVKLADFGMAKHVSPYKSISNYISKLCSCFCMLSRFYKYLQLTGQVSVLSLKGSPYWMAPEVLLGAVTSDVNPEVAFAVDIWSVGCTIIEMLNGKPPWGELEGPQAMFKVLNKSPAIPAMLSAEGKEFLQLCFRRNPAERPSASKLLRHPFLRNSHDQQHNTFHFPA